MSKGKLIVLEGLDGSGKGTHKGGRLPYRCDSAKMIAEGVDLVNGGNTVSITENVSKRKGFL